MIQWARDLSPAAWVMDALSDDHRRNNLERLMPASFEAHALIFPVGPAERRALVPALREATSTPERCWFGVSAHEHGLDTQGVTERLRPPYDGKSYLLHGGPLALALRPPPERVLPFDFRPDATPLELAMRASALLSEIGISVGFDEPLTRESVISAVRGLFPLLRDAGPVLWWPEDRAWFVSSGRIIEATLVGGSRTLIHRLLATPGLPARALPPDTTLDQLMEQEDERQYGPVIARGVERGEPWALRGRIGDDGVSHKLGWGGGEGGALPFQDRGWQKMGHFGSVGSSASGLGDPKRYLQGVVSRQAATVTVRLAGGTTLPATTIDTGDPRASFFVAVWSGLDWQALLAHDETGAELERYPAPPAISSLAGGR